MMFICTSCQRPYPDDQLPYLCPACGGVFDMAGYPELDHARFPPSGAGIWRYQGSFDFPENAPLITLGEGNTPLVWDEVAGQKVAYKCEHLNPTGSFKDRGSPLLVSYLVSRGVQSAVEDSSGNAGASFAAYAARAGITARVFVPGYTAGPKREQISAYGARVVPIPGSRADTARAVLDAVEAGEVYASHAYMPFGLPGMATLAYELFEELGNAPGTILLPVGHGSLLLGVGRGFMALRAAGLIGELPRMIAVQSAYCAPLWAAFHDKDQPWSGETRAAGVRIVQPVRKTAVLEMIKRMNGTVLIVQERELAAGRKSLAGRGFHVEYTSALVWDAIRQSAGQTPEPLVAILTGTGLKETPQDTP